MTSSDAPSADRDPRRPAAVDERGPAGVPGWLAFAAALAWRFLMLAGATFVVLVVFGRLRVVLVPIAAALLIAAILAPPKQWLGRHGLRPFPATVLTFVVAVGLVALAIAYLVPAVASQATQLGHALDSSVTQIQQWLVDGPLHLSPSDVDQYVTTLRSEFTSNSGGIIHGALNSATIAIEVTISVVLTIVLAFFFVKDGEQLVEDAIGLLDESSRPHARALRHRIWATLSGYVRGTAINGGVNAVVMGVGLLLLGVPAVLPIAMVTAIGGFFPIVGAFVAGAMAAMVALAADGPITALLVVLLTILVHNLEAYLVGPLVLARAVRLEPAGVLIALATGGAIAGVVGAALAVPVTAVAATIIDYLRQQQLAARTIRAAAAASVALETPDAGDATALTHPAEAAHDGGPNVATA